MPELNVNLPPLEIFIPRDRVLAEAEPRFLGGFQPESSEPNEPRLANPLIPATLISAASVPGQALGFQVLFPDGALYERLQVNDLFHTKALKQVWDLQHLQIWDCPSQFIVYTVYEMLQGARVTIPLGFGGEVYAAEYVGTFDWYGDPVSEGVGNWGHKAAHFVKLECGQFGLFPNNKVAWDVPAYTKPFDWHFPPPPPYKRNDKIFRCETIR